MTILLATDLIDVNDAAVSAAFCLANQLRADVRVVSAVPASTPFSTGGGERLRASSELRRRGAAAGVSMRIVEQHGDPARVILLHADPAEIDLLVLGSGGALGERSSARILRRVLKHGQLPVLAVPRDRAPGAFRLEHLLCAMDFTPASHGALKSSLALAGGQIQRATIVHVAPFRVRKADERSLLYTLAALGYGTLSPAVSLKALIASGRQAWSEILRFAAATRPDLLVMGRTRRSGFDRLRPSNSTRVAVSSPHPVLVVPEGLRFGSGRPHAAQKAA